MNLLHSLFYNGWGPGGGGEEDPKWRLPSSFIAVFLNQTLFPCWTGLSFDGDRECWWRHLGDERLLTWPLYALSWGHPACGS